MQDLVGRRVIPKDVDGYSVVRSGQDFLAVFRGVGPFDEEAFAQNRFHEGEVFRASSRHEALVLAQDYRAANGLPPRFRGIEFIREHRGYNLIRVDAKFVAVVHGLVDVDLQSVTPEDVGPGQILLAHDLDALVRQLDEALATNAPSGGVQEFETLPAYEGYNLFQKAGQVYAVMQGITEFDAERTVRGDVPRGEAFAGDSTASLHEKIDRFRRDFGVPQRFINVQTDTPLTELGPPEVIEFEPMEKCNLRCFMCPQNYAEAEIGTSRLDLDVLRNLQGLEGKMVVMGANNEPTTHPRFGDMVSQLTDLGLRIDLTTNGTMLTDKLIDRLLKANIANLIYSFDGMRKETFESIRLKASYERTLSRITACQAAFREARPEVFTALQYILMKRTLGEVVEAVDFWNEQGIDHMGLLGLIVGARTPLLMSERLEPVMDEAYRVVKEVAHRIVDRQYRMTLSSSFLPHLDLASTHPANAVGDCVRSDHAGARLPFNARTFFQNGFYPGMHVGCRSPFKYARVYYDGTVRMCAQFSIGNLRDKPFLDIWYGEEAVKVRRAILGGPRICHDCDYYRHCLSAGRNERSDERNQYFGEATVAAYKPTLIETNKLYTIIQWRSMYYGIPSDIADYDVQMHDHSQSSAVVTDKDLDALKVRLASLSLMQHRPELVDQNHLYSVVEYRGVYYGVLRSIGDFDVRLYDPKIHTDILTDTELDSLKARLDGLDLIPTVVESHGDFYIVRWRHRYFSIPAELSGYDVQQHASEPHRDVSAWDVIEDIPRRRETLAELRRKAVESTRQST